MNPRTKRRLVLSTAVVGTLASVLAAGAFGRSWYRSNQLAERRQEGLELFRAGRYDAALDPLSFAARDNDDLETVLALAECRMRVPESNGRHFATAAGYFRAVEARDPKNIAAMRGLLEAYLGLGRLPEIQPVLRRLLALDPNDARAHEIELEVLSLTGRFEEGAAKARVLQALQPLEPRWRAAEIVNLERAGADAPGRLARVREWRADTRLTADPSLALLEADLLRETGRAQEARTLISRIAEEGVRERRTLETLIASIESAGFEPAIRDTLVEKAISGSRSALANPSDAIEIEGERLLRAGRFDEIERRFSSANPRDPGVFRLRFAALYLSGRKSDAEGFAAEHAKAIEPKTAFVTAVLAAKPGDAPRARIEAIGGSGRACPADPVLAIMLADVMLESGEFDEAQSILVRAYEASGAGAQPVGVRAVRTSVALGRVRDAFRIAEDLLFRFGPAGDGTVALVAAEAWASVLDAGYTPPTRGGLYGSDSPEALRRFWIALGGEGARSGPAQLAPAIADVFASRGDNAAAREILENSIPKDSAGLREFGGARVSQALDTAAAVDPGLGVRITGDLANSAMTAEFVELVAERLAAQGQRDAALGVIDRAMSSAESASDGLAKARLERVRATIDRPEGLAAWITERLKSDRSLEMAIFTLSRSESWKAADDAIVTSAVETMKSVLGPESIRVLVAEAAISLAFHADDRSRLAASIAALDAASIRSPDSASVLATLAALFERQSPPQYDRSARLLSRAVEAEPGTAAIYPQLINALQQIGDFTAAERALDAYVHVVGDDLQAKRSSADLKFRQGQLAEAAQIREQLVGRSKEVVDAIALARIRHRMGDLQGAQSLLLKLQGDLDSVLSDEGASNRALLIERELALLHARDGRMAEARASLDRAESRLRGVRLDEVRANVELAFGDAITALRIAEGIAAADPQPAHDLLLARVQLRLGNLDKSRDALLRALEKDPENPESTTVAATLLVGDPKSRPLLDRSLSATAAQRPDLAAAIELLDGVADADGRLKPDDAALARAMALTAEYSSSPLSWRLAAHLHAIAGRLDDAFRIAQRALTRLPSDPAIGRLATEAAIAAGRADDAASAVAAWRKMSAAEALEVDVARASIELMSRRADRAYAIVAPMARDIAARPNDPQALRVLVTAAVLSGKSDQLVPLLAEAPPLRRSEATGVWLECSQSLEASVARASLESAAKVAGTDPVANAALAAAWTQLCREGDSGACSIAERLLEGLRGSDMPSALLASDLMAARGDASAALTGYRAQYLPIVESASAGLPLIKLAEDPAARERIALLLRKSPNALVAMHNAALVHLERAGDEGEALALATLAAAALPDSPDILDTEVRALVAAGRSAEALSVAQRNPDPVLSALGGAESHLSRRAFGEAERFLSRADARLQGESVPVRALVERIRRIRAAIAAGQSAADATEGAGSRSDR